MLYQLSYTPKHRAEPRLPVSAVTIDDNGPEPEWAALAVRLRRRKPDSRRRQAAARFRFSSSIAFAVDAATGVEKI